LCAVDQVVISPQMIDGIAETAPLDGEDVFTWLSRMQRLVNSRIISGVNRQQVEQGKPAVRSIGQIIDEVSDARAV